MYVMTGYIQASTWNVGIPLKWAWKELANDLHLARLEADG